MDDEHPIAASDRGRRHPLPAGGPDLRLRSRPARRSQRDDRVLVETERGPTLGTVVVPPPRRAGRRRPLPRVVKKADARDLAREDRNLQRERELHRTALELIRGRRAAACKLVKAESALDGSKVTVFFRRRGARSTSATLVRDLGRRAAHAHRDEADRRARRDQGRSAASAPCGRELCCSSLAARVPAGVGEDGEGAGPVAESVEARRHVRPAQVLPALRVRDLRRARRALPRIGTHGRVGQGRRQVVAPATSSSRRSSIRRDDDGVEVEATLEDLVARAPTPDVRRDMPPSRSTSPRRSTT